MPLDLNKIVDTVSGAALQSRAKEVSHWIVVIFRTAVFGFIGQFIKRLGVIIGVADGEVSAQG
jgi:hypothetical protein